MNRHQSNPFLAGWETNDEAEAPSSNNGAAGGITNQADAPVSGETTGRRHSQSGNPFGGQRPADRRLYHRNMSSFDAASQQLEQQQQMQENGSKGFDGLNTDIIAKMTADFQSAIGTSDKQFSVGEILDDDGNPIDFNPFDPFETIVDDDVSLPSLAQAASSDQQKFNRSSKDQDNESATIPLPDGSLDNLERSETMDLDKKPKTSHDSIDEDEDDLVSTPVRNIKSSSPQKIHAELSGEDGRPTSGLYQAALVDECSLGSDNNQFVDHQDKHSSVEKINSIEKASLFASLLASAESGGQPMGADEIRQSESIETSGAGELNETSISPSQLENPTHVIKGSHSAVDGDRPVGFFDPFETVIDKDELTSLMNEASQQTAQLTLGARDVDLDRASPQDPKVPDPTPIHGFKRDQNGENDDYLHETGSTSLDTANDGTQDQSASTVNDDADRLNGIPRPARVSVIKQEQQTATLTRTTPSKRPKAKKKPSFQEDSSDSSEDDDRIQIVIKARGANQAASQSGPAFVPLLPPPPSKSSMKQARERGQVDDMPSPVMGYKSRHERKTHSDSDSSDDLTKVGQTANIAQDPKNEHSRDGISVETKTPVSDGRKNQDDQDALDQDEESDEHRDQFVIPMTHSDDDGDAYGKPDTPLYDEDTSYVLDDFPAKYEGPGWEMMLRYPPKKKLTSNRFWKKIFVKLAQVPIAPDVKSSKQHQPNQNSSESSQTCIALQIFDKPEDKKPMQEIPIQATYTVSEISSQQFDQFGKIFTIKLQYIFYKERVGVRQGQLARFIHTGHIGSSTTSGGHGADPISIGAIKRLGAPIEHSPQISQIIKLGCTSYNDIKQFKNCLEDYLFKMPIHRDRALSTYKTEEVQMAVRDETYLELNQVGTIIKQLARVRIFFLSFLNGMPTVEVGINDIHRQGREVVGRMDILPVMTEEWIRLEACELHSTVDKDELENPDSRIIKLVPPDATFFELIRFRIRPPRNRELPLQISANMSVTRTKVSINCDVMVPGCVSRKHGQIPCEAIAIKVFIPECWIYFFREEKHFRMGSKKSVNRRPGKVKGIERLLGGGGLQDINDESSLIEVTSGQAKYEHHHNAIVWRAARWPKESQSAYVQNNMKIRLPLTAYDKMPDSYCEYVNVEYTMPSTTVSHTTLRSISVNPCDDEPPEKYVKYSAKYEYKVKMRLSINLGSKPGEVQQETSPIVIMKQPDLHNDLQREEDSDDDEDDDDDEEDGDVKNLNVERANAD